MGMGRWTRGCWVWPSSIAPLPTGRGGGGLVCLARECKHSPKDLHRIHKHNNNNSHGHDHAVKQVDWMAPPRQVRAKGGHPLPKT